MYTAHYGLKIKPFQISSDSKFMWLGENHKEALATLRYGILDNKGFLLLTGDVGTGKTTLINVLIGSLSNDVIFASVPDPSLDKMDFFNYIATAFGLEGNFDSKGKFLTSFASFLHKAYDKNQKVLLIIDESQLMTQELLEETRLLSNIVTKDSSPLLNIFFVGQYEFNELIRRPENRAIAQRLTLNYYIEPLTFEETGEYIRHRLKIAGTTKKIFNTSAIKAIYNFSKGFPRKINIICDHCLMSGYADEKTTITSGIVTESIKELQIPEFRRDQVQEGQITGKPSKEKRESNTRSITGLLFVTVLLLSFSFIFLYYTNLRYKEATAHFTSIQEKFALNTETSSGNNNQAELQAKTVTPDNNNNLKSLVKVDSRSSEKKINSSAQKISQTTPATATPREKPKDSTILSKSDGKDIQTVPPESVKVSSDVMVQSLLVSGIMKKDSSRQNSETLNLPFPDETLVIRFKHDSNIFSVTDIEIMKNFAQALKGHPEAIIEVKGYTDSSGDAAYNRKLSEFRANMVKSFLMGQNLSPEQLRAEGLGNENPVDSNDTEQGRMMNRRVEIKAIVSR